MLFSLNAAYAFIVYYSIILVILTNDRIACVLFKYHAVAGLGATPLKRASAVRAPLEGIVSALDNDTSCGSQLHSFRKIVR
jgi:hypothetical protein